MQSSGKSLTRLATDNSAAAPHGRAAAASLDQDEIWGDERSRKWGEGCGDRVGPREPVVGPPGGLADLSLGDLRLEWRQLLRADPPRLSRDIMIRAVAYRLQEIAHGGASKATLRRLATLAAEFEKGGSIAPSPSPKIKPGSRLVREWHGRIHTVSVTDDGFEFQGKAYRSLTKIARDITGARWSGPRFFGLTQRSATAAAATDNLLTGEEMTSANPNG